MKALFGLLVVGLLYPTAGVLLYRERVLSDNELWGSDFIVFVLPALIALLGNAWFIGQALPDAWRGGLKATGAFGLSVFATLLEMCATYVVAFNAYGT